MNMSFGNDLIDSFDQIGAKLNLESKNLRSTLQFFQLIKKQWEGQSQGMTKSIIPLRKQIPKIDCFDSVTIGLKKNISKLEDSSKDLSQEISSFNNVVLEPCELFLSHYETTNKAFCKEASSIIHINNEIMRKLAKAEIKYRNQLQAFEAFESLFNSNPKFKNDVRKMCKFRPFLILIYFR